MSEGRHKKIRNRRQPIADSKLTWTVYLLAYLTKLVN